jgi:hypothetical protein
MLLALLAMSLPVNIGGWGPREGVTAWAFGAAGLSATQGLTIAVAYGLFAFVAALPGAVVLIMRALAKMRAARLAAAIPVSPSPVFIPAAPVDVVPVDVVPVDAIPLAVLPVERGNVRVLAHQGV